MVQMLVLMLEGTLTSVAKGRMSRNRLLKGVVNLYIQIMRGTPLILQLIFVYFAPFYIFGVSYDRFTAVIIAYVVNYSAYFAEIYRSGLQSIEKGQYEASRVLGFSRAHTFFFIVLPQVIKRILPSLANEVITLVKDTALAQTIGVAELFRVAQNASAREFSTVPIFVAGVFYFVMNFIVSKVFDLFEKKLSYYR